MADLKPCTEEFRGAVYQAVVRLLREGGYTAVSIERVAQHAGVVPQDISRWWSSKGALVCEAFLKIVEADVAAPDTGDFVADLHVHVDALARFYSGTLYGRYAAELIGAAQSDPDLAKAILEHWLLPGRAPVLEMCRRAQRSGELRADIDPQDVVDLVYGPLYHRMLLGHAPLTREYAAAIVDMALRGIRAGGDRPAGAPVWAPGGRPRP